MPTPYKILVVDDEADLEPLMLQRMRRQMRSGQYTFVFARNGVEALEILNRDESVDMVISDINMPQMDGLTLLNEISKLDADIRAIIISAYGDMDNIRAAMNRGAFDFVTKPLDFSDLRATIDRTLVHLEEWREAMATRDRLVSLQNELNVATGIQRSILPTVFPSGPGLPDPRGDGACSQRGRRFLRLHSAARRPNWPGRSRRLGQGRSRRAVHDVEPNAAQGLGYRHNRARRNS